MRRAEDIARFIRSSFLSIWALELLLHLRKQPWESFDEETLVNELRASSSVVSSSIASLLAVGLVVVEGDDRVRYSPVSEDLANLVADTEELYKVKPDAVRRVIVVGSDNLTAFADAFRLRRD